MIHDEYLKRRDELQKIRTDSFNSFDKAILSLSTGSLALSITFLDKIGTPFNQLSYFLIFATWISQFCVILANLLSYLFAKSNMDKKIKELDDNYRKQVKSKKKPKPKVEKTFWQKKATNICNNIAFISFFISIVFFTLYIIIIQNNNYNKTLRQQLKGTIIMAIEKSGTGTEAKDTTVIINGKVETPAAVSLHEVQKDMGSIPVIIRGQTESPQAVDNPSTTTTSKSESK